MRFHLVIVICCLLFIWHCSFVLFVMLISCSCDISQFNITHLNSLWTNSKLSVQWFSLRIRHIAVSAHIAYLIAWIRAAICGGYVTCGLIVCENTSNGHFSCYMGKYSTRPDGHLIHWTSALHTYMAFKWTQFAYHIIIYIVVNHQIVTS